MFNDWDSSQNWSFALWKTLTFLINIKPKETQNVQAQRDYRESMI